ncbi:hypothetical protein KO495_08995 [Colwellia sp. D2M02]|uniref:Replicative DNA helicase n=1 Tax=Colwellia asteriadis TaxID=517723 RepID=A0ABN1LA14_9GAMM|nr:hypothetical protein [Colwellia sp. D2M02]MBU2893460.1 hypothetical protein [Colwellia sp. D2M02]
MKAPLFDEILTICQDIANASSVDNDEARLQACKKLQVLCATNQNTPNDHPLQWEALADFTEDGDQAMDIYQIALVTAEKMALNTFKASITLAMAQRYHEFEEIEKAQQYAAQANELAGTIDDEELQKEINDFFTSIQ